MRERRSRNTILSVQLPNGEWVYPDCRFAEQGLVLGIEAFIQALPDADPWTRLAVLVSPSGQCGGRSTLDLLGEGRQAEALGIAASHG